MKWNTLPRKIYPKHGDVRTTEKFAWIPVDLIDGHRIWWESYLIAEKWDARYFVWLECGGPWQTQREDI